MTTDGDGNILEKMGNFMACSTFLKGFVDHFSDNLWCTQNCGSNPGWFYHVRGYI